jgi:hypothetical protein
MDYKLALDVLVAILLVATIIYAYLLNLRLEQLRSNRDELAKLVAAFNEATARAESGIPKLRQATEDAGTAVQERVEKAQLLRDDLAFMIERADSLATRLEETIRTARSEMRPNFGASNFGAGQGAAPAVAPVASRPAPRQQASPVAPAPIEPIGILRADESDRFDFDDERSEAEIELLRALQSSR